VQFCPKYSPLMIGFSEFAVFMQISAMRCLFRILNGVHVYEQSSGRLINPENIIPCAKSGKSIYEYLPIIEALLAVLIERSL
jgi:hypothetical protein